MRRRFGLESLAVAALCAGCGRWGFDAEPADEPSDFIFVTDDRASFDLGDYFAGGMELAWTGEEVALAAAPFDASADGVYLSPVFDTGVAGAEWTTLAWLPSAPYGRPLPDSGADEVGYARDGASMAANHLLLHLDGSALGDGDRVADSSGGGNHGQVVLADQAATPVTGEFGGAFDLERDAWVSLDGDYFDYGTGDFTYSIWVKMRDCAESNDNRIAMGGAGAPNDRPHMWIGALCPDACPGGDGAFMNFLDDSRNGPSLDTCTGVVLTDGDWHHLAGVKIGHTPALVHLYVDGREVDADSYDYGTNTLTYVGGEIRLGSFNLNDPQYNTSIVVDEAAIWKRGLGDAEIAALYRRGALELGLQIRVCEADCGTQPFVGPDGTSSTYFTEADLTGAPGSQSGNLAALGLRGARAQYRARFATSSEMDSPGLRAVTLRANRP